MWLVSTFEKANLKYYYLCLLFLTATNNSEKLI